MLRLIARLTPPVLMVSLVYGLWTLVLRFSLDHAARSFANIAR